MFAKLFFKVFDFLMNSYKMMFGIMISSAPSIYGGRVKKYFRNLKVGINGNQPHDIRVLNPNFYHRIAVDTILGLGESYMDGWWEFVDPNGIGSIECLTRMAKRPYISYTTRFFSYVGFMFNRQTRDRALEVVEYHYDKGNDLFENFLDKNMQYSCGYWKSADNLEQAQIDKMDLIARKLKLKPGMKVLELGSGFGMLAKYLAEKYGVSVVAYNISVEQVKFGKEACKGLPVEFRLEDYRNAHGSFDRVYSIAFLEAVGHKNFKEFYQIVHRCLKDEGLALVHTITLQDEMLPRTEVFTHKHIFPNGQLPYMVDLVTASNDLLTIEDIHNFGYDYYKTLEVWRKRFIQAWPKLQDRYGERFFRLWMFYLTSAAGCFRARTFHLIQVVYSKKRKFDQEYISER